MLGNMLWLSGGVAVGLLLSVALATILFAAVTRELRRERMAADRQLAGQAFAFGSRRVATGISTKEAKAMVEIMREQMATLRAAAVQEQLRKRREDLKEFGGLADAERQIEEQERRAKEEGEAES